MLALSHLILLTWNNFTEFSNIYYFSFTYSCPCPFNEILLVLLPISSFLSFILYVIKLLNLYNFQVIIFMSSLEVIFSAIAKSSSGQWIMQYISWFLFQDCCRSIGQSTEILLKAWSKIYYCNTFFPNYTSSIHIVNNLESRKRVKWSEATQLCLTLCDPMDCSPPGFSVHGIFQARVPEWVAFSFSKEKE